MFLFGEKEDCQIFSIRQSPLNFDKSPPP